MKIYIMTYVDLEMGAYHDSRPLVDVYKTEEDAEDAFLRQIDPDIAEAYRKPEAERDEYDEEYVESALRYLKEWTYYGDNFAVSIDTKEV